MIPVLNPQEGYLTCVESACTHLDGVEECGIWEGDAAGLDPICAHLGDRHVQSLTRDDVEALVEWMASRTPARSRAKGPR